MVKGRGKVGSRARNVLSILLILGMLVSLFLLYEHFSETVDQFCTYGESLNCGIVNKSPYANLDGISYLLTIDLGLPLPLIDISGGNVFLDFLTANAFLGFLTLLILFLLNTAYRGKDLFFIRRESNRRWIIGILMFSVAYGFYLFLIQHYVLKTYCVFCLLLDVILISSLITAWRMR